MDGKIMQLVCLMDERKCTRIYLNNQINGHLWGTRKKRKVRKNGEVVES